MVQAFKQFRGPNTKGEKKQGGEKLNKQIQVSWLQRGIVVGGGTIRSWPWPVLRRRPPSLKSLSDEARWNRDKMEPRQCDSLWIVYLVCDRFFCR